MGAALPVQGCNKLVACMGRKICLIDRDTGDCSELASRHKPAMLVGMLQKCMCLSSQDDIIPLCFLWSESASESGYNNISKAVESTLSLKPARVIGSVCKLTVFEAPTMPILCYLCRRAWPHRKGAWYILS